MIWCALGVPPTEAVALQALQVAVSQMRRCMVYLAGLCGRPETRSTLAVAVAAAALALAVALAMTVTVTVAVTVTVTVTVTAQLHLYRPYPSAAQLLNCSPYPPCRSQSPSSPPPASSSRSTRSTCPSPPSHTGYYQTRLGVSRGGPDAAPDRRDRRRLGGPGYWRIWRRDRYVRARTRFGGRRSPLRCPCWVGG
jgi:hypothetical protein